MLRFPSWSGTDRIACVRDNPENSRAEHAHIGKILQMRDTNVQGLAAAHGQAGNCPMRPILVYSIMTLGIRLNI